MLFEVIGKREAEQEAFEAGIYYYRTEIEGRKKVPFEDEPKNYQIYKRNFVDEKDTVSKKDFKPDLPSFFNLVIRSFLCPFSSRNDRS